MPFIHMQLYQTLDTHRSISVRLQATPGPCALSKQCGHPVRWCASHPATARPHSALLHAYHLPRATAQTQALHLRHWSPRSDAVSTGCTLLSAFVSRGSPTFPFTGAARPAVVKPQGLRVWSRCSATSQATGTSSALAGTRSCGVSVASRVRARPACVLGRGKCLRPVLGHECPFHGGDPQPCGEHTWLRGKPSGPGTEP